MNRNRTFAFISRHRPTAEQSALAAEQGIDLVPIGDADAFSVTKEFVDGNGDFQGVVVVHPAAALRLAPAFMVGVYENGHRPAEGDKPAFFAKALHVFDQRTCA